MAWSPLARVVALAILVAPATGLAAGSDGSTVRGFVITGFGVTIGFHRFVSFAM